MQLKIGWWRSSFRNKPTAEASQQHTLADSQFYTAQKKADGDAYQNTKLAEAEASSIGLTSQAQLVALRNILQELKDKGILTDQYIQVLIARELNQNSKWIISNGGTVPVIDFRETTPETQPTATAP